MLLAQLAESLGQLLVSPVGDGLAALPDIQGSVLLVHRPGLALLRALRLLEAGLRVDQVHEAEAELVLAALVSAVLGAGAGGHLDLRPQSSRIRQVLVRLHFVASHLLG